MKRLASLFLAAALAVSVTACGSDDDAGGGDGTAAKDSYTIGVANFMLGGPYFSGMDKAIAAQAKKKGNVEIISTDANGDAAKLASNVEDLLSKNVDAIIISGGPLESAPGRAQRHQGSGQAGRARRPQVPDRRVHQLDRPGQRGDRQAGRRVPRRAADRAAARSPSSRAARPTTPSASPAPTA